MGKHTKKIENRTETKQNENLSISSHILRFAFTLAEVLIVLGIIGIIAEITLPALITNFQYSVYTSKLEKMNSVLSNGFKQILASTGCEDLICAGITSNDSGSSIDKVVKTGVFNVANECIWDATGCDDTAVSRLDKTGTLFTPVSQYYSLIVLEDGSIFGAYQSSAACTASAGNNRYSSVCWSYAIVDVNGTKPPNVMGRDVFRFYLLNDGSILPAGGADDTLNGTSTSNCKTSSTGNSCFFRIISDGWKMNY